MVETAFAVLMLAVCTLLLMRLMLGRQRRQRFDASVRRAWVACQRLVQRARGWPASRRKAKAAAEAAIRRARKLH
jgi:hypothetical protein